jgi:hypothetical protein
VDRPSANDAARIKRAIGWRPSWWRRAAPHRPLSANVAHWIAGADDRSAFIKIGLAEPVTDWVRVEHRNLAAMSGPHVPRVLGYWDDGQRPVLALEDLSDARWPPPWSGPDVSCVLEALAGVHSAPPPAHLQPLARHPADTWDAVAADPSRFLSLGLCSDRWLEAALPALRAGAAGAPLEGASLVHLDVRSDNLCFQANGAVLVDWNHAAIANPDLDIAFWLPSLHAEGGPRPEEVLPDAPGLAAWVAGFLCSYAGEPPIELAPHVRPLQLRQARTALPWAARALGLDPPTPTADAR